ncbi:MAG: PKD domain-containing protein [Thermoplasmata archaeon]|nr:PKD domain-containing protein [Thermoplasmata archaeon]
MVLLIILLSYSAGCLEDEGDDDNGDDEPVEVVANAGTNVVGVVGEPVTFNASASSGPIVKYTWGISVNVTSPNLTVLEGIEAEYTFTEAGKYLVTLTVVGDKDQNSSITMHAFINLIERLSGTISLTERNETFEYTIADTVQAVSLTLTYATGTLLNPYTLDMEVYAGEIQPLATTAIQLPDQGDTQVEELDLSVPDLLDHGGLRIVVRLMGTPTSAVSLSRCRDHVLRHLMWTEPTPTGLQLDKRVIIPNAPLAPRARTQEDQKVGDRERKAHLQRSHR